MKIIIAAALFLAAGFTSSAGAAGQEAVVGVQEAIKNINSMLGAIASGADKDSAPELTRKLRALKAAREAMGEENVLRMQLLEEMQNLQAGVQFVGYRGLANNPAAAPARLAALKQVENALEEVVDQKEFRRLTEKADAAAAKNSLAVLRGALRVYTSAAKGAFPEKLSELTLDSKYIPAIPAIVTPGHVKKSAEVKYAAQVKTMADLLALADDAGGWLYVGDKTSPLWGTLVINCSHADISDPAMKMYNY
ncbi:MAG: hypothetical protein NDI60_00810 [Elusimicrobiales bacterium]|nr:hypothetical protein [Elusimicrobiales bacterium]